MMRAAPASRAPCTIGEPDPAEPHHEHGRALLDARRVEHRADARLHRAADHARDVERHVGGNLHGAGRRHEDVLGEGAEADAAKDHRRPAARARWCRRRSVFVRRAIGVHADARLAAHAPVADAARRQRRQHDRVADGEAGHARADRVDHARRLVARARSASGSGSSRRRCSDRSDRRRSGARGRAPGRGRGSAMSTSSAMRSGAPGSSRTAARMVRDCSAEARSVTTSHGVALTRAPPAYDARRLPGRDGRPPELRPAHAARGRDLARDRRDPARAPRERRRPRPLPPPRRALDVPRRGRDADRTHRAGSSRHPARSPAARARHHAHRVGRGPRPGAVGGHTRRTPERRRRPRRRRPPGRARHRHLLPARVRRARAREPRLRRDRSLRRLRHAGRPGDGAGDPRSAAPSGGGGARLGRPRGAPRTLARRKPRAPRALGVLRRRPHARRPPARRAAPARRGAARPRVHVAPPRRLRGRLPLERRASARRAGRALRRSRARHAAGARRRAGDPPAAHRGLRSGAGRVGARVPRQPAEPARREPSRAGHGVVPRARPRALAGARRRHCDPRLGARPLVRRPLPRPACERADARARDPGAPLHARVGGARRASRRRGDGRSS